MFEAVAPRLAGIGLVWDGIVGVDWWTSPLAMESRLSSCQATAYHVTGASLSALTGALYTLSVIRLLNFTNSDLTC